MNRIKEQCDRINQNKYYKRIIKMAWYILCTFFFAKMILNLGYVSESAYQVIRDYYFGIAVIYMLLAIVLLQKVKISNILIYIFGIIYCIIAVNWLKDHEMSWGAELQNFFKVRWIYYGIIGVLVIDMLRYKKIASFKERNMVGSIMYLIIALIVYFMTKGRLFTHVLIVPFMFLFLMRVKKEAWQKWIFCLTSGYYLAFMYTMICSFVSVPYTGDRYYGIYVNHGLFGMYIGGAFVCSLWWLILAIREKKSIWIKIFVIATMIFSLLCLGMNGARVAELAVVVTAIIAYCLYGGKQEKKQIFFRIASVSLICVIGILALIIAIKILGSYDKESFALLIENDMLRAKLEYFRDRAYRTLEAESSYGLTEPGSFLNVLDRFSSDRISYYIMYLRGVTWKGNDNFLIPMGEIVFDHPHNTFIYWLYGLGILPGILLIIWILYYVVYAFVQNIKKNSVYMLPLFWVVYYIMISMNEDVFWIYIAGVVLLILQYPVLVKFQEDKFENHKKKDA